MEILSNVTEVNHWWSVVDTRNHLVKNEEWQSLLGVDDATMEKIREENSFLSGEGDVQLVIPLIDLPNHYQPKYTDL